MTDDKTRAEFEEFIKSPPFEHMCDRNGDNSAWPGHYKRYETQIAWDAWQAAKERYGQPSLPQDVEEWIGKNSTPFPISDRTWWVPVNDLRAFIAGKVLVDVGVIERALTAIRNELENAHEQVFPVCCGRSGEECCGSPDAEWPDTAKATMENLGSVEKELAAMLTATKGV